MSLHDIDRIWQYALGTLVLEERTEVARHVEGCSHCAAEQLHACEVLAQVGLALPAAAPPPPLLARILDGTHSRFGGIVGRLAELWDLSRERAGELLDSLADAVWEPLGVPGVEIIHVQGGPRRAGADAGFVRLAPRARFPHHRHLGDEVMLLLEGDVVEDDGTKGHAGDAMAKPAGSSHSYTVGPDGCLVAVLLYGGIEIEPPTPR
jgi:anti-sigma factor ChrR (cupin superfamily)